MAAAEYSFEIEQGASFYKRVAWKDSAGVPVDLTSYTARMQVRQSVASPVVLFELTTENGRIVLGGSAGTIELRITAEDTAAIAWRRGKYDLELVAPDASVTRFLFGQVSVSFEVTR